MKQKNETTALLLSLLLTVGLISAGGWWLIKNKSFNFIQSDNSSQTRQESVAIVNQDIKNELSSGDKLLISQDSTSAKQAAIAALASGNYQQAVTQLETSLRQQRNDPEALIYLNNARISENQAYTIAVAVPIGAEVNAAKEILRGVAQAQNEINSAGGINGIPLKVIIANDNNDPNLAQQVAQNLTANPDILGVVGHFGSNVTAAAAQVYQQQGLVVISPTSTAVTLSLAGNYVFRTVPSDRFAGNALAQYLLQDLKLQKAAVFYNSASDYSTSLKDVFTTDVLANGGEVVAEFDFANRNFNAASAMELAQQQEAQALVLLPNSATLDQALLVVQVNDGKLPLLGGDSVYKPQTLQIAGKDGIGMVLAVPWHILGNGDSQFPQTAASLWGGDVNWRTAMAYDATKALIAAIASNPSRSGVQTALSSKSFSASGAAGAIRFFPSGDRNQAVQLVKIVPGARSGFDYDFVPVR